MSSNRKRLAAVSSTLAVVLVGGGLAIAYWTTTGTGSGSGTVGTSTPVSVNQDSPVSGLVPGGPASDLDFTVHNGSAGPQTINSVVVSISNVNKPGCTAADFDVTQPALVGAVELDTGDTTFTSGVGGEVASTGATVSMLNLGTNQDACKGAALTFTYTVS